MFIPKIFNKSGKIIIPVIPTIEKIMRIKTSMI
jgi:hypothetical protein